MNLQANYSWIATALSVWERFELCQSCEVDSVETETEWVSQLIYLQIVTLTVIIARFIIF